MPIKNLVHRDVWSLAGPMVLSNLTVPLVGLVDTAVMGHMSDAWYLGAVALGALIFSFIYWGFGFLRMGTTGLTAQAFGRDDGDELRAIFARAMVLVAIFALLLWVLQTGIRELSFWLLEASNQVETAAIVYFDIRIWSAPATLATYVLIGWFLGMQDARSPLYILLLVNVSNMVLDLFFVLGLDMGVAGVALASVIAEYLGVAMGVFLLSKALAQHPGRWTWQKILCADKIRQTMLLNQNIFIRTLCLVFSFAFFTAQGAKHGDVILAANAILMNFQTFMAYALDGFAHAAEALVGRAVGKRHYQDFRRAVFTAGVWSLLIAVVFSLVYFLFGQWIIDLMTTIPDVRQATYLFLPWLIISPLVSVWSYLFDGVFIGSTRSAEMRNTMLVSTVVFFLPAWYFLQPWGNHGLWAALLIFMVARAMTMAWSYRKIDRDMARYS